MADDSNHYPGIGGFGAGYLSDLPQLDKISNEENQDPNQRYYHRLDRKAGLANSHYIRCPAWNRATHPFGERAGFAKQRHQNGRNTGADLADRAHLRCISPELYNPTNKGNGTQFWGQILPLIRTIIKLIIWSLGLLIGLKNAGFDVGAMLAGLGIGGLAFALAAQDTVSNMFGGITIFLQRPFKVDDLIMFEGKEMIVKEIGLRATRLTDESYGHTIYIPNSMFTGGIITNISAEPGF